VTEKASQARRAGIIDIFWKRRIQSRRSATQTATKKRRSHGM
jgi:hypothetical protein